MLKHRAYMNGTRYYDTPECFLYFLSRLLEITSDEKVHSALKPLLRDRLKERIGSSGDALALAMRVLACTRVGISDDIDMQHLLSLQREDGGWDGGRMYKYGSSGVAIRNSGLTTALSLQAILTY